MALSQSWNGGGLLAGIGGANMNAPQANDVNATLALIRDNNAQQASGANNMGLQALQGLGGVAQAYQQSALAEGQKAFNQAHAQAWATGDTSLLRQFALQNPAFVEKAQQAVGHLNDQQKADIGSLAAGMRVSLSQGPEAFSKFVNSNGAALQRVGADPGTVLQMGVTDPQQAQQFVDTLGMSSLGGKDYFDAVDKQQGRKIDVGKLQETIRSNQAGEAIQVRGQDVAAATARRGQDITMRGQDISASNSAADRELRKFALQQQAITNQLSRAKTQAEVESLNLKLDQNKRQQVEAQQQKQVSLGYASEAAQLAKALSTDPDLGQVTGSVNTWTPVVRNSSQDVLNNANRLQSLLTSDNLKLMSGVLTDRDIVFLGNIASGLNITDKGIKGSEASVRKRLSDIATKLDSKLSAQGYAGTAQSQVGAPDSQPAAAGGFSNLWGD